MYGLLFLCDAVLSGDGIRMKYYQMLIHFKFLLDVIVSSG